MTGRSVVVLMAGGLLAGALLTAARAQSAAVPGTSQARVSWEYGELIERATAISWSEPGKALTAPRWQEFGHRIAPAGGGPEPRTRFEVFTLLGAQRWELIVCNLRPIGYQCMFKRPRD